MNPRALATQFDDEDMDRLVDALEESTERDIDYVLGLLHAVAVAPGLVGPSIWMQSVFPFGDGTLTEAAKELVPLLLRLYNDIVDALAHRMTRVPVPDEIESCRSFAAGYAEGASLDPEWIGHDDRWTFAAPIAMLGERYDLVSPELRAKHGADAEYGETTRKYLAATVAAAYDSFAQLRRGPKVEPRTAVKPGRNDPCRCGSGKKFKRCCG